MVKYSSIEQFKNVIKEVTNNTRYEGKDENGKNVYNNAMLPVLRFKGTTKLHGCFEKNTPILMADGTEKSIYEIEVGDYVKSYDIKYGKHVINKVLQVYHNYSNKKWVKLTFTDKNNNRELICTEDHRIYVQKYGWVEAKKLVIGDPLLSNNFRGYKDYDNIPTIVKIEEYPIQDEYDIEVEYTNCFFANCILVHNSNGSIQFSNTGNMTIHSRERTLSLQHDNMGFYVFGSQREKLFRKIREIVQEYFGRDDIDVCIFGEYAGKGIQKGVAVSELEKSMFIFDIKVISGEESYWLDLDRIIFDDILEELNKNNIYFINQYKTWEIDIDFNNPELVQNQLIRWTTEVGDECPVGKAFGISSVGEGVVFKCDTDKGRYIYKVKGTAFNNNKVVLSGLCVPLNIQTKIIQFATENNTNKLTYEFI